MLNISNTENLSPFLKIVAAYVLLVVTISLLPGNIPYETVKEGGPIETLSAGGYFLFCIFLFHFNWIEAIKTAVAPGFFVLLLGLRELDFHARFTTMGMFKSRFYISPDVPIVEKAIVGTFVIGLIVYAVWYLLRVWPFFKRALRARRPWAVSLICAVGCVVFSKALDGNSDIYELLLPMLEDTRILARIIEECMELLIPLFFIRSLLQYSMDSVAGKLLELK